VTGVQTCALPILLEDAGRDGQQPKEDPWDKLGK
jgi:hypothetical protein